MTLPRGSTRLAVILAIAVLFVSAAAFAQLNGPNIKGDAGLKAGSQAPPGAYVAVPLWFYTALPRWRHVLLPRESGVRCQLPRRPVGASCQSTWRRLRSGRARAPPAASLT
jgi:hypothetical protein